MTDRRPIPNVDNADSQAFWAGVAQHTLLVPVQRATGTVIHPPRDFGQDPDIEWVQAADRGHVYTWTVCEHSVDPEFPAPYTLVLVALADRPEVRLIGHLPGRPEIEVGTPMTLVYEDRDGVVIPQWVMEDPTIVDP